MHGRIRSVCKACGGASLCEHGVQRYYCRTCGGGVFCEHGRQRPKCKECRDSPRGVCSSPASALNPATPERTRRFSRFSTESEAPALLDPTWVAHAAGLEVDIADDEGLPLPDDEELDQWFWGSPWSQTSIE